MDRTKAFLKREFTGGKLAFNLIFWGMHWGLFVLGWYVLGLYQSNGDVTGPC